MPYLSDQLSLESKFHMRLLKCFDFRSQCLQNESFEKLSMKLHRKSQLNRKIRLQFPWSNHILFSEPGKNQMVLTLLFLQKKIEFAKKNRRSLTY